MFLEKHKAYYFTPCLIFQINNSFISILCSLLLGVLNFKCLNPKREINVIGQLDFGKKSLFGKDSSIVFLLTVLDCYLA